LFKNYNNKLEMNENAFGQIPACSHTTSLPTTFSTTLHNVSLCKDIRMKVSDKSLLSLNIIIKTRSIVFVFNIQ
jgi:hypothetical protein